MVSIALSVLANTPIGWGYAALVALVPLMMGLYRANGIRDAFAMGWGYGIGVILCFHNWMLGLGQFAPSLAVWSLYGVFAGYLGIFFGMATGLGWWLCQRRPWGWVHLGLSWALFDMLRTMGPIGTPSGSIAYAVGYPWNQVAAMVGASGLMMMLAVCQAMLAGMWVKGGRRRWIGVGLFILGIGAWGLWGVTGWGRTGRLDNPSIGRIRVGLVQPNHPQTAKFNQPDSVLLQDALSLSSHLTQRVSLIIWPETALLTPLSPLFPIQPLRRLSPVLLGLPTLQGDKTFNSIVLVEADRTAVVYHKQRLMPFGEYWPLAGLWRHINGLEWVGESFSAGGVLAPFNVVGKGGIPIKWGGGICLEAVYPWVTRRGVQDGATAIVMVANNAWFEGYPAGIQLMDMARLRAIETQREIVFCSNSGPSGVIRRDGEIEIGVGMGERGTSIHLVRGYQGISGYVKMGDRLWWGIMLVWLAGWVAWWIRQRV